MEEALFQDVIPIDIPYFLVQLKPYEFYSLHNQLQ